MWVPFLNCILRPHFLWFTRAQFATQFTNFTSAAVKCCSRCYAFLSSVCLRIRRLTDCPQLQNVLTGSRAPPPPIQWAAGTPSRRKSGRVVRLIRHLHLMPKLRISGSIPPLLLYAFISRIGTTLLSPFTDYFEEAH